MFVQDRPEDADEFYRRAIDIDASSEIAETAQLRLSEIAQKIFRSKTPGAERMDAVMDLIGAIEKFGRMSKQKVQKIGIEIATLGLMEFRLATESCAPPARCAGIYHSPLTTHQSPTHRRLSAERGARRKQKRDDHEPPRPAGPPCTTHHSPLTTHQFPTHHSLTPAGGQPAGAMYSAFKISDPAADRGSDLAQGYSVAEQMARDKSRS